VRSMRTTIGVTLWTLMTPLPSSGMACRKRALEQAQQTAKTPVSTNECNASTWQALPNRTQTAIVPPQVLNARRNLWIGHLQLIFRMWLSTPLCEIKPLACQSRRAVVVLRRWISPSSSLLLVFEIWATLTTAVLR
jgi:hypothetical protein